MKYLKRFNENFLILEHAVGDMVYVNVYGPKTTRYSSHDISGSYTKERDLPFRPPICFQNHISNFNTDNKYEIIHMDGYTATLYDEDNNVCDIDVDNLYDEKIISDDDYQFIKDCIISSFEDMPKINIDKIEYLKYIDEMLINISVNIEKKAFDRIFHSEFLPRLRDHGYDSYRTFGVRNGSYSYEYSNGVQICVTKKK